VTVWIGRPVLEESAYPSVRKTRTALLAMNAVTASGVKASANAHRIANVRAPCVTPQQTLTLLVNTVMLPQKPVSQGVQMTASAHLTIPSVVMGEDLTSVDVALTRTVVTMSFVTRILMNASPSLLMLVVITIMPTVPRRSVTSLTSLIIPALGVMTQSVYPDALMTVNAPQTNQSVEPTVNLIAVVVMWTLTAVLATSVATMNVSPRSAPRMMTVHRMKSVTLSTLLTTCSVSTAKMTIACLGALMIPTAPANINVLPTFVQQMMEKLW